MPTICKISLDAEEYRKELAAVVAETRAAQEKLSGGGTVKTPGSDPGGGKSIQVSAEVSGQDEVQELSKSVDALPAKKNIRIQTVGNDPGKTITAPSESVWKRSTRSIRECWKEMTNLKDGAKQMVSGLVAGGGLIGVAMAGIQGAIKCVTTLYDTWIQKGKDAAQVHVDAASAIGEAAANNDRLKTSSKDAVAQLGQLANAEKLSNAQKSQAITLISQLTKQYGDLGVKVNEATGRIEGLSEAIVAKQEKDSRRKIIALQAQIKELQKANQQENQNIKAGVPLLFGIQVGGEKESLEAAERIRKNTAAIMEKQLALNEEKKRLREASGSQLQKTQVENAALDDQARERNDQTAYSRADADFSRAKTAAEKIANRQSLIDGEQPRNDELRRKTEAAKALMDKYAPGSAEASALRYEDARKAYQQNAASLSVSDEKIAGWNEQIHQIQHEQSEGKRKLTEQSAYEAEYQKLLTAGEYDKAAALKQEKELRDQNLKLTEEETRELLEQRKVLREQSLRKNLRDQAFGLYGQALEASGRGEEAARQKALRDAEQTKGGKLTEAETALVEKLSGLQYAGRTAAVPYAGDLAVKTNALTSRGGFQGGVKAADTEKLAREACSYNKRQADAAEKIKQILENLGRE